MDSRHINVLGFLACLGAVAGVAADLLSGWSSGPTAMSSALSLDIDSIKSLYVDKPRWTFVLGNYLAVFFLPFHMLGFILVHEAIAPAGRFKAILFLGGAFYFVAVGTGYHGTFAFIADTIQSGDALLLGKMVSHWTVWGIVLVSGYAALCIYLIALILTGKTLYPITTILITPPAFLLAGALAIWLLPLGFSGIKTFLAVTGLNLPLLVFYCVTWRLLSNNAKPR